MDAEGREREVDGKYLCSGCKEYKEKAEFHPSKTGKGGVAAYCRKCHYALYRDRAKKVRSMVMGPNLIFENQSAEVKRIVEAMMAHPRAKRWQIAKYANVKIEVLGYHLQRNEYLRAVHDLATKKLKGLVPLAMKGYADSLDSKHDEIKFRSSWELLKSEKIMGPERIEMINSLDEMTVQQLQAIVDRAARDPMRQTIIDVEPS